MRLTREHIARIQEAAAARQLGSLTAMVGMESLPDEYSRDGVQRAIETSLGNLLVALGSRIEEGARAVPSDEGLGLGSELLL